MALDTEEQQQIEDVKKWLKENGLFIIVTIILVVAFMLGYQQWKRVQERDWARASVYFEQLLDDLGANKIDAADQATADLVKKYPRSVYAKLAELLLAKDDVRQGHEADAEKKLAFVAKEAQLPALRQVARLRLARLQIQLKQPQQALTTLQEIDEKAYLPEIAAVQGDAYVAMNNIPLARENYRQALTSLPEEAILHQIVSMKFNNLPN
jgi:predicted negative regulator of RcsB-dependent stress response